MQNHGESEHCVSRPGIVAGAVLRAGRLSSGLSDALLAAAVDVDVATINAWEDGSEPLASVPYPHVERLEAALRTAGAERQLVADLDAAIWYDLVALALNGDGDTGCLMADPVASGEAFRELLAWFLAGRVPNRYRPYASAGLR